MCVTKEWKPLKTSFYTVCGHELPNILPKNTGQHVLSGKANKNVYAFIDFKDFSTVLGGQAILNKEYRSFWERISWIQSGYTSSLNLQSLSLLDLSCSAKGLRADTSQGNQTQCCNIETLDDFQWKICWSSHSDFQALCLSKCFFYIM